MTKESIATENKSKRSFLPSSLDKASFIVWLVGLVGVVVGIAFNAPGWVGWFCFGMTLPHLYLIWRRLLQSQRELRKWETKLLVAETLLEIEERREELAAARAAKPKGH